MPDTLAGVIDRVTFHNLDNGYCVLRVTARGQREPVTVVGHLPQCVAGEAVEASGEWVTDRNHGRQFKADLLATKPPFTAEGIARYLGSGLVKGIGPKYARKIVDTFGDRTLDIIDRDPGYLTQVKGIGKWSAQMFLMFRLGRPDVLPELDLGIQKAIKLAYGLKSMPKPKRVLRIGKPWSPYASVASWYLWRSLDS